MMNINRQDLLFNRTSLHSLTIPWGLHIDHCEASLRDSYGVSFLDSKSCWDSRYTGHFSYLPFQSQLGLCEYSLEPAFIRKRNERERQRVRCVNEGYAQLRQHLPQDLAERRLSKVETLRAAIGYIKRLQDLLDFESLRPPLEEPKCNPCDILHMTREKRASGLSISLQDSPQNLCLADHQRALRPSSSSDQCQRKPKLC